MAAWLFSLLLGLSFGEGLVLVCLACYLFATSGIPALITGPDPLPQAMASDPGYGVSSTSLVIPAVLLLLSGLLLMARSVLVLLALFTGKPVSLLQETGEFSAVDIVTGTITRPAGVDIDVEGVAGQARTEGSEEGGTEYDGETYAYTGASGEGTGGEQGEGSEAGQLGLDDIYQDPAKDEPWTTELSEEGHTYAGQRAESKEPAPSAQMVLPPKKDLAGDAKPDHGKPPAPAGLAVVPRHEKAPPSGPKGGQAPKARPPPPPRSGRGRSLPQGNATKLQQKTARQPPLRLQADGTGASGEAAGTKRVREVARVTAAQTLVNVVGRLGGGGGTLPEFSSTPGATDTAGGGNTAPTGSGMRAGTLSGGQSGGPGRASSFAVAPPNPTDDTGTGDQVTNESPPPIPQSSAQPGQSGSISAPVDVGSAMSGEQEEPMKGTYLSPGTSREVEVVNYDEPDQTEEYPLPEGSEDLPQPGPSTPSGAPQVLQSKTDVLASREVEPLSQEGSQTLEEDGKAQRGGPPQYKRQERAKVSVSNSLVNIVHQT